MRRSTRWLGITAVVALAAQLTVTAAFPMVLGPQLNGTGITPEGWRLTPAGSQTNLGNGPVDLALSPDGAIAIVANAGYQDQSLMVVDAASGVVKQVIAAQNNSVRAGPTANDTAPGGPTHFYFAGGSSGYYIGLAFSPDGSTAYASDGPGDGIHTFSVAGGLLHETQEIKLPKGTWPAGIAVSADGGRLYVAGNLADDLLVLDTSKRKVLGTFPVGHLPYGAVLDHTGSRVYVSNWGASTVSVLDVSTGAALVTLATGLHPSALALNPAGNELYVANTDADTVAVIDTAADVVLRTIDMRLYAGAPVGTSPDALAVSPDGSTLYVANAGNNDVAVIALARSGSVSGLDRLTGLIPTGWEPTAISVRSGQIDVVNMYGLGVGAIAPGQYIGSLMRGTLSRIAAPGPTQLAAYTAQVTANDRLPLATGVAGNPIPARVGLASPIKHVIYVLKENRTFDQVLGDLGKGNGDPSYEMFPYSVTPNQHTLAGRFVTLDNFYTDGAVSADGWSWSTEGYANTYIDKNWPPDYGIYGRPYDFGGFANGTTLNNSTDETGGLVATPATSFLWDRLAQSGVSYRNYGFFMGIAPVVIPTSMPNLVGHTDPNYTGWDLKYSDQQRMDEWMREFAGYQASGSLPTMEFVYLPQDHTMVTATQQPTPSSMIADNDLALGRLVDAVSHSQFWSSTAIFVVEDDAQDGPDHVSGHRTIAQLISPYSQTGAVDSTQYSTVSMLRTMELILGLQPMTQFDAAATPMYASMSPKPDLTAYTAIVPQHSLTALNPASAPMAAYFASADWSAPDAVPEDVMNAGLEAAVG
jgi:YVTN family beta-propeller protein